MARRYVNAAISDTGVGRQYSLVGDAELDEGAVWEAVLDPSVSALGEIVWVIDLNRQSLDRVVPNIAAGRLKKMFAAAGWQVITVTFGRLIEQLFARPQGEALRRRLVSMPNPEYQRLLRCDATDLRRRLAGTGPDAKAITELLTDLGDDDLMRAVRNLGGHDLEALRDAYNQIDDSRPTAIIAYTIKGYGLPTEGHPQNHSSLLTVEQFEQLAAGLGLSTVDPWARFETDSAAGRLCEYTAARLRRESDPYTSPPPVPSDMGRSPSGMATTQAALGRALLDLSRQAPDAAKRVVTVSPDVSSSTNLAGWLNKVGVWAPAARQNWFADDAETIMHWRETPAGQHMELGIAEVNLVGLMGELGSTWSRWGEPLFPIGVLYDPFVERALEPWSYGMYAGGQSILVGTPSGVTLAAEGGAHQSIKTPSIGLEQPSCISYEPAFAIEVEWMLFDSIARLGRPNGSSSYLRLSTRLVDQTLAAIPTDPAARQRRRDHVLAGAYLLHRATDLPAVTIVAMGALVTEALQAADRLTDDGFPADVVCVTSPGKLFDAVRARRGLSDQSAWILDQAFPVERSSPMVTVLDGHPHTLAFLANVNRVPCSTLGVTGFGQSGSLADVYHHHGIDADAIVRTALDLIS